MNHVSFNLPGTASVFTPKAGTAQLWRTSAAVTWTLTILLTGTTTLGDIRLTPNGSFTGVISIPSNFNYEFNGTPTIRINTNTGFGAEFVPLMSETNQSRVDDSVKPLVGITSVIDCV